MGNDWTDEEVDRLRQLYPDRSVSIADVAEIIDRSVQSVQAKARRLGLIRKGWSHEDEDYLRKRFKGRATDYEAIGKELKRSGVAVRARASRIGLLEPINLWTEEENKILAELYLKRGTAVNDIVQALPGRTWDSILQQAQKLTLGSRRKAGFVRTYHFDFD